MPEILVFARALLLGLALAEIFRIAYLSGNGITAYVYPLTPALSIVVSGVVFALLVWYAVSRGLFKDMARLIRSQRVDLLFAVLLGIWANDILSLSTQQFHDHVAKANPLWALLLAAFFLVMMVSSLTRPLLAKRKAHPNQMFFLTDGEIQDACDDVLAAQQQSLHFAQTVLASNSSSGLIYGVDAPWGTGKTSFINLASNYWQLNAADEVVVFRFEPNGVRLDS